MGADGARRAAWRLFTHAQVTYRRAGGASARRHRADFRAAGRRRRPRLRPRRPATAAGASISPLATRRSSRATISGATPTTAGSSAIRSRPTAPAGACGPCSPRMIERAAPRDRREPPRPPTRPAARSATSMPSWMDEAGIEARGIAAAAPLSRPDRRRRATATTCIRLFATPGYPAPVGIGIMPDPADPTRYIAVAGQAGLGMPNRDYYLREGEQYDRYRAAYRAYIVDAAAPRRHRRPGGQGRRDHRARAAHRRGALDARSAAATSSQIYNPMNRAQLDALAPQFEWTTTASAAAASATCRPIIAAETTRDHRHRPLLDERAARHLEGLDDLPLPQQPMRQYLPRAFDEANFNFYSRTLRGVAAAARPLEARPRPAQRHDGRGGRRDLCRAPLPGREPAADERADRQSARRLRRAAARGSTGWTRRPAPQALAKLDDVRAADRPSGAL